MTIKERLSATVEADLLAAGRAAVADGRAESLSAWVNDALRRQADHDRRLKALDEFLRAYEDEYGEITEDEIQAATRSTRGRAVIVRSPTTMKSTTTPGERGVG
jgi:Arc/MetJ-type ribon-helix-helix transcriptional regulator